MLDYILIIIKLILIQIAYNTLLTKLFLSCFIVLFLIFFFSKKKTKITIEDLGIMHGIDLIPFVILFVGIYIFGLFYMRFCNFGKSLNLKDLYNKFMVFLINQELNYILITILFYILLCIIFIIILNKLMNNIKLNLFKIHIYIISFFPLGFFEDTLYNTIKLKYMLLYMKASNIFLSSYRMLRKKIYKDVLNKKYDNNHIDIIEKFLFNMRDKNALIILILLIFYDIIFNNFILTKMYYFLPFVFLYNLIILIDHILSIYEPFEEGAIASHLYFDIKQFDMETFEIQYTNNIVVTVQDLKDIEIKLNKFL